MELVVDLEDRPPIADAEAVQRGALQLPVPDRSRLGFQIKDSINDADPIGAVDGVKVLIRFVG